MFKQKKIAFFSPILTLMLVILCPVSIFAAVTEKEAVTVQLTDYGGEVSELRMGADENLNDSKGNLLLKEGEEIQADFAKEGNICIAQVELYKNVRYYISDGVDKVTFVPDSMVCKVSFDKKETTDTSGQTDLASAEDESSSDDGQSEDLATGKELNVKTKTPKAVTQGDMLKCTVSSLSGSSDTDSDTFLLQCEVPKGTTLESVYTGSYNADVRLDLICKTEKDGQWHTWGEGISSAKGETFNTDTISFSEGDRICAFAISAAEAPKGFCLKEEDPCYYYVKIVDKDSVEDYEGLTKVTAYLDGKKSSSESKFTTLLQAEVQTGDENVIFIGSFILLCISVITLVSYVICRVIFYKKDKAASQMKLPVTYRKGETQGTQGKMSDLLEKKPG